MTLNIKKKYNILFSCVCAIFGLWGAGSAALGVPYCAAFIGSHWNNFFNDPFSRWHFDSNDDQLSIKL